MFRYLVLIASLLAAISCTQKKHLHQKPLAGEMIQMISATSQSSDSQPFQCLFNDKCNGTWSPGTIDSGHNEGLHFRFSKPVSFDYLVVNIDPKTKQDYRLELYLDGKNESSTGTPIVNRPQCHKKHASYIFSYENDDYDVMIPMKTKAQSFYLKLETRNYEQTSYQKIKVKEIKLYQTKKKIKYNSDKHQCYPVTELSSDEVKQLKVNVPTLKAATVTASSTLEPYEVYRPQHLFDSKTSRAWSTTDGKNTKSVGESISLSFKENQSLSALVVWNGYQRSHSHLKNNSSPAQIELSTDKKHKEILTLKNKMGPQYLKLKQPIDSYKKLKLTIQKLHAHPKYPETLVSELKLVDKDGYYYQPQITPLKIIPPQNLKDLINRSFGELYHGLIEGTYGAKSCNIRHVSFRSDGSFVYYQDIIRKINRTRKKNTEILEGNWTLQKKQLRIFAQHYRTIRDPASYIQHSTSQTLKRGLLESSLEIHRYNTLSPDKKTEHLKFLWKKDTAHIKGKRLYTLNLAIKNYNNDITASNETEFLKQLDQVFSQHNPYLIKSPHLSGHFVPTDSMGSCYISP